jgi:hypothetical protein
VLQLPPLAEEATRWHEIAGLWRNLADTALPAGTALFDEVRDLSARVTGLVAEGDEAADERRSAALRRWSLFEENRDLHGFDFMATLEAMSNALSAIFDAETEGIARLAALIR